MSPKELEAAQVAAAALVAKHGALVRAGAAIGKTGEAVRKAASGAAGYDLANALAHAAGLDLPGLVALVQAGEPVEFPDEPLVPQTRAPTRAIDRDDAPWKQLAEVNASFDAWAGGRYRRATDKDATVAGLNYAARMLPRHSEEGGAQVQYRAKEMMRLALIGEALDRGEDVEEDPLPPSPPPLPPTPPRPSLAERAAKIEEESKARSKRGSGGTKPSM